MKLFAQTQGRGPDVVLLHGWGLHSGIWEDSAQVLSRDFRVTLIDLPGHGQSQTMHPVYTLPALAALVAEAAPPQAVWIGWSLGGLVAMQLALDRPMQVIALALVASTPRFAQGPGWLHALSADVLEVFAQQLESDYRYTVKRFLALQAHSGPHAREGLRRLTEQIFSQWEPESMALQGSLGMLREADLRDRLAEIACPVLLVQGERDMLVPLAASQALVLMFRSARMQVILGAGHAPFLSHPQKFTQIVYEFLHEQFPREPTGQSSPG